MSLPVRGAWIEIETVPDLDLLIGGSLPVRGAWIEIMPSVRTAASVIRRSPCGERGLKYRLTEEYCKICGVAPRAGSVD